MDKYKNALQAVKPKKAVQEKPGGKNSRGGKSSNPDYRPTTVFFLESARKEASKLLIDGVCGDMDFSDLINSLLVEWVAKQKKNQ